MPERIWIAGRHDIEGEGWEILGLFLTREQAIALCSVWNDFVAPVPFGVSLGDGPTYFTTTEWPLFHLYKL